MGTSAAGVEARVQRARSVHRACRQPSEATELQGGGAGQGGREGAEESEESLRELQF